MKKVRGIQKMQRFDWSLLNLLLKVENCGENYGKFFYLGLQTKIYRLKRWNDGRKLKGNSLNMKIHTQ